MSRGPTGALDAPTLREGVGYYWRLMLLVRPHWGRVLRGYALGVLVTLGGMATPYFAKMYFDGVYPARDFGLLRILVLGIAAYTVASAFMEAVVSYYSQVAASQLSSAVTLMYYNHLHHLPLRFFEEHQVGEITSRFADMRSSLSSLARVAQIVLSNGLTLLVVPTFLALLNVKLAIIALITTPATTLLSAHAARLTRRYLKGSAEANSQLTGAQVESLAHIRTVKSMVLEHHLFREAAATSERVLQQQLYANALGACAAMVNKAIRAGGAAILSWYAWSMILSGNLTIGAFVAFTAYVGYLTSPISRIPGLLSDFQSTTVSLGRAFEYLDVPTEQAPAAAYTPPPFPLKVRGLVDAKDVTFRYGNGPEVLRGISFSLRPGTITCLLGPSGTGKSTILRLLCRMDEPKTGRILLDNRPFQRYSLGQLRQLVGVVWQDTALFRGTLLDNLTIGLTGVPQTRVDEVIEACQLETFVRALPDGYQTVIGEWGATLSGGQRQRLALARAVIRDTPVLLLDEVTSQLDAATERDILKDALPLVRERTILMVTHRMAVAALADRILAIDDGQIAGASAHAAALAADPSTRGAGPVEGVARSNAIFSDVTS